MEEQGKTLAELLDELKQDPSIQREADERGEDLNTYVTQNKDELLQRVKASGVPEASTQSPTPTPGTPEAWHASGQAAGKSIRGFVGGVKDTFSKAFSDEPFYEGQKTDTQNTAANKATVPLTTLLDTMNRSTPAPPPSNSEPPYIPTPAPTPPSVKEAVARESSVPLPDQRKIDKARDAVMKKSEAALDKESTAVKAAFKPEFNRLQSLQDLYRDEANKANDRVATAEVAEKIGHALAQLGAGIQGMKTGVDMSSGLKFDRTDWSKRYDNILSKLREDLGDLRSQRQSAEDQQKSELSAVERRVGKSQEEELGGIEKDADRQIRAHEGEENRRSREQQSADADAARKLTAQIAADAKVDKRTDAQKAEFNSALTGYEEGLRTGGKAGQALLSKWQPILGKYVASNKMNEATQQFKDAGHWYGDDPEAQQAAVGSLGAYAPGGTPPQAGTVRMRDPKTGQVGNIPTAKIKEAEARGLVQVQ